MDPKTKATPTIAAVAVLCGCPGLFSCFMGGLFSLISLMPGAEIDVFGSSDPKAGLLTGVVMIVIGLVGLAVTAFVVRSVRGQPLRRP